MYPIEAVNGLPFEEGPSRFRWLEDDAMPGFGREGIAETFPLSGRVSLYGATKLASELILQEYAYSYRMPLLINRCGVLTGPWQMGKVDQGVITFWVARHHLGMPLRYTGFGGLGKQVRDLLHVDDLFELLLRQFEQVGRWDGRVYNVGGGLPVSTSLAELTETCREVTGRTVAVGAAPETASVDVRIYVTDARRAMTDFDWRPRRTTPIIVEGIHRWLCDNIAVLQPIFQ